MASIGTGVVGGLIGLAGARVAQKLGIDDVDAVLANPQVSIKLLLSGITTAMVSICYYKCVQLLPASVAILLLMQFTWIGVLIDWIACGRRPSITQLVAVVMILCGTALAGGLLSASSQAFSWIGVFYGIVSAVCFSLFIFISGHVSNTMHPIAKSAIVMTGSCITVFLIFPPLFLINGSLGGGLANWALWLSVFGVVIPPVFLPKECLKLALDLDQLSALPNYPWRWLCLWLYCMSSWLTCSALVLRLYCWL